MKKINSALGGEQMKLSMVVLGQQAELVCFQHGIHLS
jgi:hypothetical protein